MKCILPESVNRYTSRKMSAYDNFKSTCTKNQIKLSKPNINRPSEKPKPPLLLQPYLLLDICDVKPDLGASGDEQCLTPSPPSEFFFLNSIFIAPQPFTCNRPDYTSPKHFNHEPCIVDIFRF